MPLRNDRSIAARINNYSRDERDRVAAEAILREAKRWGHDEVSPSLAELFAARALDAVDKLERKS